MKKLLGIFLFIVLATSGCGSSGGGGSSSSTGTTSVTINLGGSATGSASGGNVVLSGAVSSGNVAANATTELPAVITNIRFTVKRDDEVLLIENVSVVGKPSVSVTLEIPNGDNTLLIVEALNGSGLVAYSGEKTLNLTGGSETVTIDMKIDASAIEITCTDSVAPINDLEIPFGSVQVITSASQTVTITNDGIVDIFIYAIADNDPLDSPFSIADDNCSNIDLTPSSSCTLTVNFSPLTVGTFNETFDIPSNDPDENPLTIELSGTGTPEPVPDIEVTDSDPSINDHFIDFGDIELGESVIETITVTNGAAIAELEIDPINQPVNSTFKIENDNCSSPAVAPNSSCTLTVRFTPSELGFFNDTVVITSNDPDEQTITITLEGTGVPVPEPDIVIIDDDDPATDLIIDFGDVKLGLVEELAVIIGNTGTSDLNMIEVASTNPVESPFSFLGTNCPGSVIPNDGKSSCFIEVLFSPTQVGAFNDSFNITSNDPDEGSVTFTLRGQGAPVPEPDITVTDPDAPNDDLNIDFGTVDEGSRDQTVTVKNDGTADLEIGNMDDQLVDATFNISDNNCSDKTIAPEASCTLTVSFTPSDNAPFNNSFDIPSNDPDENPVTIALSGFGGFVVQ